MRKFTILLGSIFFFYCGVSASFAESAFQNDDLSQRIKKLRQRLETYHISAPKKVVEVKETVELKLEEIVENLETRDDVKVTVLFQDPFCSHIKREELDRQKELRKPKVLTIDELRHKVKASATATNDKAVKIKEMLASLR